MTQHYHNHPLEGLAERRNLSRVSATAIAAAIGLETPSYRRLERGERRCYLDKAFVIAQAIGCTVEELGIIPNSEERVRLFKLADAKEAASIPATSVISAADEIANAAMVEDVIELIDAEIPTAEPLIALTVEPEAPAELNLQDLISAFDDEDDDEENDLVVLRQQAVTLATEDDDASDDDSEHEPTPPRTGIDKYTSTWAG